MENGKALLIIDMQNDYLWDNRKPKFSYDTETLVKNVNSAVSSYSENGYEIIYIAQVFPDIATNRLFIGFSIKDTEGAKLFEKLCTVSDLYFEKKLPDAYSSKAFRDFAEKRKYSKIVLCGLDECGCVAATAKGAVKSGAEVFILKDSVGCRFSNDKRDRTRSELSALGVSYI